MSYTADDVALNIRCAYPEFFKGICGRRARVWRWFGRRQVASCMVHEKVWSE